MMMPFNILLFLLVVTSLVIAAFFAVDLIFRKQVATELSEILSEEQSAKTQVLRNCLGLTTPDHDQIDIALDELLQNIPPRDLNVGLRSVKSTHGKGSSGGRRQLVHPSTSDVTPARPGCNSSLCIKQAIRELRVNNSCITAVQHLEYQRNMYKEKRTSIAIFIYSFAPDILFIMFYFYLRSGHGSSFSTTHHYHSLTRLYCNYVLMYVVALVIVTITLLKNAESQPLAASSISLFLVLAVVVGYFSRWCDIDHDDDEVDHDDNDHDQRKLAATSISCEEIEQGDIDVQPV